MKGISVLLVTISLLFASFAAPMAALSQTATPSYTWTMKSIDPQILQKNWAPVPQSTIDTVASIAVNQLKANTIANGTPYDNPSEWQKWQSAAHAAGAATWGRSHWNGWEGDNGVTATMTPSDYIAKTDAFLRSAIPYLRKGDKFTYCVEPENGAYWIKTYGSNWSSNSAAVAQYNQFIRDGVAHGQQILAGAGFAPGDIDLKMVSTNAWVAENILDSTTLSLLGKMTLDHYVEYDTDGTRLTYNYARMAQKYSDDMDRIRSKFGLPILAGEWGHPIDTEVSDDVQAQAYEAILGTIASKPYMTGVNIWTIMGNTSRLLNDASGTPTTLRQAASVVTKYFSGSNDGGVTPPPPTPTNSLVISNFESDTAEGWSGGQVAGSSPDYSYRVTNPAYGSVGASKRIDNISLAGWTHLDLTIDLHGNTILPGDASQLGFDQGGQRFVSLRDYVTNGLDGKQKLHIPLSAFKGWDGRALNTAYPAVSIFDRFWNYSSGNYDIDDVMLVQDSGGTLPPPPPPPTPVSGFTIADFSTGMQGFNNGTVVNGALSLTNRAYDGTGSAKLLNAPVAKGYNTIELDIDLGGKALLGGDASMLAFDQGGYKYVSLASYVKPGVSGFQHVIIPLSQFSGLDPNSGIAWIVFRFWNMTPGTYLLDNITLTQR